MSTLPHLQYLNVSNNALITLQASSKKREETTSDTSETKWKSLTYLDISYNKLTEIEVMNFPKLLVLNVNNNEIRKIENLEGVDSLEVLKASNNQIVEIGKLHGLPKLKELYLVE